MSQHDTDVQCPSCKEATIVAEVQSVATESHRNMPMGPRSKNHSQLKVVAFHCSKCQVMVYHPPGKPDMAEEILSKIKKKY